MKKKKDTKHVITILAAALLVSLGVIIGQNLRFGGSHQPQPKVPPLSKTEYWISDDVYEQKKMGFASWVVLKPDGHFVLEKCVPGDYSLPKTFQKDVRLPLVQPTCETVIDGRIKAIADDRLEVLGGDGGVKSFGYALSSRNGVERLVISSSDDTANMSPGSKNALMERLDSIPSVAEAKKKYLYYGFSLHAK